MRRVLRILLHAASVLSALICVAVVALWVRGYWSTDRLFSTSVSRVDAGVEGRVMGLIARRGRVGIHLRRGQAANNGYAEYLADATNGRPTWRYLKNAEM